MRSAVEVVAVLCCSAVALATGAGLAMVMFDVSWSKDCQSQCVPVTAEDTGQGVICIDRAEEVEP